MTHTQPLVFTHAMRPVALGLLLLQTSACDNANDDSAGTQTPTPEEITVHFTARFGDEPFDCSAEYSGVGLEGSAVTPLDLRLYIQSLALIAADGSEVAIDIAEVAPFQSAEAQVTLLDFEDNTGTCVGSDETYTTITGTVPEGDYQGLRFVNGVPEDWNHGDPTAAPGPLQVTAMHWSWLGGYRFLKAEVSSADNPEVTSVLHTGSTHCTGTPADGIECAHLNRTEVLLEGFDPNTDTVLIDLKALYAGVDLAQGPRCHGQGESCEAAFSALGVDTTTGAPLSTQTVFKAVALD